MAAADGIGTLGIAASFSRSSETAGTGSGVDGLHNYTYRCIYVFVSTTLLKSGFILPWS